MPRIKVTPEQVRQVAAEFKKSGHLSQEMVSRLQSTVNSMQPDWEGMTQQRFYQEFQQWRSSMNQFVQLLTSIGQQLDAIAERFATVDQQR